MQSLAQSSPQKSATRLLQFLSHFSLILQRMHFPIGIPAHTSRIKAEKDFLLKPLLMFHLALFYLSRFCNCYFRQLTLPMPHLLSLQHKDLTGDLRRITSSICTFHLSQIYISFKKYLIIDWINHGVSLAR